MRIQALHAVYLILCGLCTACTTSPKPTNLDSVGLLSEPSIDIDTSLSFSANNYSSFAVIDPLSILENAALSDPLLVEHLLFQLDHAFVSLGYVRADSPESADFVVTLDASIPYQESYVPPSTSYAPLFLPGQQSYSMGNYSGTYAGRNFSGNYNSVTNSSPSTAWVPVTRPGYYVGYFYPTVRVIAADRQSPDLQWIGTGIGSSENSDIRIAGQLVLNRIVAKFPRCEQWYENYSDALSRPLDGIWTAVLTANGNDYYPTVIRLEKPASDTALEEYDFLIALNGRSLRNKTPKELLEIYSDLDFDPRAFTVKRLNDVFDISIVPTDPLTKEQYERRIDEWTKQD